MGLYWVYLMKGVFQIVGQITSRNSFSKYSGIIAEPQEAIVAPVPPFSIAPLIVEGQLFV